MADQWVWNDAVPPSDASEQSVADFLAKVAFNVGLQEITLQDRGEWLWRWVFLKAIECHSRHDAHVAEAASVAEAARLAGFLDRFCGATFKGPVMNRGKFIAWAIEDVTNQAQDLADIAAEENDAVFAFVKSED